MRSPLKFFGVPLKIPIAIVESSRKPLSLKPHNFTLHQLETVFSTFEVGEKDGESFIPASFRTCPSECAGGRVDCGGGHYHRLSANVLGLSGLCVDLDHSAPAEIAAHLERFCAHNVTHFWWETFSHTPEKPRARIFFPFAEVLIITKPHQWSHGAWDQLVSFLGLKGVTGADEACRDPARLYFPPRKPSVDAARAAGCFIGSCLDWRPIVALPAVSALAKALRTAAPITTDLAKLREHLQALTEPMVGRVLRGEPPTPAPQNRAPGEPSRYVAWLRVTSLISIRMDAHDAAALEAVLALIEPAWFAETVESPDDFTPWETIENLMSSAFGSAPDKKAEIQALNDARRASTAITNAKFLERLTTARASKTPPAATEAPAADDESAPAWTDLVKYKTDSAGNKSIRACPQTFAAIFSEHPDWRGNLRFNTLRNYAEIHGGPLWDGRVREMRDVDDIRTTTWLSVHPEIGLSISVAEAHDRLVEAAHANPYDPLEDYLNGLQWDGTPRIRNMLIDYFRAQTHTGEENITEHVRTISYRWMLSAVARGFARETGAKVDTVLTTESGQGARKSQGLAALGGDFFTDKPISIKSADDARLLSQMWIVEIGELESLNTSSITAQKAFLSATFDQVRAVYGRHHQILQRRAVFAGSTNEDSYLVDPTGNRRHWPIACGEVDVAGLRRDRDALWAEAVAVYKAADTCAVCAAEGERCSSHRWWLTRDEEAIAAQRTEERMTPSLLDEKIESAVLSLAPAKRPASVSVLDAATWAGELDRPTRGLEVRLGHALKKLGFVRRRVRLNGVLKWRYETPARLRGAPAPISRTAN